ncbi:MAG: hypothetical protein AAGD92_00890 [Pseudomonadota bacterium]
MNVMTRVFAAAAMSVVFVFSAQAEDKPLTEDQTKRFIQTLPAMEKLGDEFNESGKSEFMQKDAMPKAGEAFKPYSTAMASLKKNYPADLKRVSSAVKPHGFSADQWASVGDRVMVAYMALQMEAEDPRTIAMMEGMDQSMIDMMPPEARAQMEGVFAMMETVRNVPEADKAMVRKFKPELDAHMNR